MSISGINRNIVINQHNEINTDITTSKINPAESGYHHGSNTHNNKTHQQLRKLLETKNNAYHGAEFAMRMKTNAKIDSKVLKMKKVEKPNELEDSEEAAEAEFSLFSSAYFSKLNLDDFSQEFGEYFSEEDITTFLKQAEDPNRLVLDQVEQLINNKCPTLLQKYLSLTYLYNYILINNPDAGILISLCTLIEEIEMKKSGYLFNSFDFILKNRRNKVKKNNKTNSDNKLIDFLANCATLELDISTMQIINTIDLIGSLLEDDFENLSGIYSKYVLQVMKRKDQNIILEENGGMLKTDLDFMKKMFLIQSMYHNVKKLLLGLKSKFNEVNKKDLLKKFVTLPENLVTLSLLQNIYKLCDIEDKSQQGFTLFVRRLYPLYKYTAMFNACNKMQAVDKLLTDLMSFRNSFDNHNSSNEDLLKLSSYVRQYHKYA